MIKNAKNNIRVRKYHNPITLGLGALSIRQGPKVLGWWLQATRWMGEAAAATGFYTWTEGDTERGPAKAGL